MEISQKRIPRTPDRPVAFVRYVLRHCSARMKWLATGALGAEIVAAVTDLLFASWMLGRIVGVIAEGRENFWPRIGHEMIILVALWLVRCLAFRMRELCERNYVPELLDTTRELLFSRLIQQSQAFVNSNFAGVLANHVRRGGDVVNGLRDKVQYNITPLITRFITGGILLWTITPLLTAFIFSFIVISVLCALKTAPRWTALSVDQAETSSQLTGYIVDGITNLSAVQQNVGWPEERRRLFKAHGDMGDAYRNRMRYVSWFWSCFDIIMTFFFCGFMALVAYGWQHGDVSTAKLAMAVGLVNAMFGALASTVSLLGSKFDDIGILQDALHKISTPLTVLDAEKAPPLSVTAGSVEFRNVDFNYVPDQPLFEKLNLFIPAGQKIGLVGVSGAGKTTLCQLLLRAYDVNGGGIYIDGQNIAEVSQDSLHAAIAVIPQEPLLFHRTLGENIRYGRLSAGKEDVRAAAQAAEAAGFIEKLPAGYDTLVGERGVKLSGGQRQRVAIARAIVKDAHLLVLDEATSALDSETEKSIQGAMMKAMAGRTTLVIAHRLSTLSHMDRIVVMDKGRVIEDGSFADLMALQGMFYKLWQLQAGGFLPEKIA